VHFGVILPNYGRDATPDAIRRTAELRPSVQPQIWVGGSSEGPSGAGWSWATRGIRRGARTPTTSAA
jgi:hypothetical protein